MAVRCDKVSAAGVEFAEYENINHFQMPIHLRHLISITESGDLDDLRQTLEIFDGIIDEPLKDGATALHLACVHGHLKCVQFLLDSGANFEANDEDGGIPLHYACAGGYKEIAQLLLNSANGPDLVKRMLETTDVIGDSPLHRAARGGYGNVVTLLLDYGASPTTKNLYGEIPAELAHPGTEARSILEEATEFSKSMPLLLTLEEFKHARELDLSEVEYNDYRDMLKAFPKGHPDPLKLFSDFTSRTVLTSLRHKSDELLLSELARRWKIHKVLVQEHFGSTSHTTQIFYLHFFYNRVSKEFKSEITNCIIPLINQVREENFLIWKLPFVNEIVAMHVEVGIGCYKDNFESAMLNEATTYYSRKASQWIMEDSCSGYLIKVEESLKKEKAILSHCLQSVPETKRVYLSTQTKLLKQVSHQLLTLHFEELLEKEDWGFCFLLRNYKLMDLGRMRRLLENVPQGLEKFGSTFMKCLHDDINWIKDADESMSNEELVENIVELLDRFTHCYLYCSLGSIVCSKHLQIAFKHFCMTSVRGYNIEDILASYFDDILRQGAARKLSNVKYKGKKKAIEKIVQQAGSLLSYMKFTFMDFYKKKLARRLLTYCRPHLKHKDLQISCEYFALSTLKKECPFMPPLVMLERMIFDMQNAEAQHNRFQQYLRNSKTKIDVDFGVTVLSSGLWPTSTSYNLKLPTQMEECVRVFNEFYQSDTEGKEEGPEKKLQWITSLGDCIITGNFQEKPIDLVVVTHQAALLLLFDDSDRLSYSEIKEQLKLEDDSFLIRLLDSLSCAKYNILIREPNDTYEFNYHFTHKSGRIKVPPPHGDDQHQYLAEKVLSIMKEHSVLSFKKLAAECLKHPVFKHVKATEMVKIIDGLVEGGLLKREKGRPTMLVMEGHPTSLVTIS